MSPRRQPSAHRGGRHSLCPEGRTPNLLPGFTRSEFSEQAPGCHPQALAVTATVAQARTQIPYVFAS